MCVHTLFCVYEVGRFYDVNEVLFFNQKTAYEMRISDWSSEVCSSDLGIAFVKLKDWSERTDPELSASAVAGRGMAAMSQVKDAAIFVFAPPAMPELGIATGYSFYLQDNGGHGHEALIAARDQLLGMAGESALLAKVRPNGQEVR